MTRWPLPEPMAAALAHAQRGELAGLNADPPLGNAIFVHVAAHPLLDRHPDHLAVNRAVHAAMRGESRAQLFEYFVYYRWRMLPGRDVRAYLRRDAAFAVDIQAVAEQKRRALDCFKSQTTQYYPWQDRPILSQGSLEEVCGQPEVFLRYDPALAGSAVLSAARAWIRFVHAFEPKAKRRKDRVMALIRRGTSRYASITG